MKLSEKGKERIFNSKMCYHCDCLDGEYAVALYDLTEVFEFEPDDFEDVVVLSIKEAKASYNALEGLCTNIEERERDTDTSYELVDGWNQMDFLESKLKRKEK